MTRLEHPSNRDWVRKAHAILDNLLKSKLESGDHGTVTIKASMRDGTISSLETGGETWWKNDASLTKY